MKKQWSKIIAMALVCAMVLPTAAFGSTPGFSVSGNGMSGSSSGGTVSGDGQVDPSTYNVVIPTKMNFAINPFGIDNKSQIYGTDYPVINLSPFAVRVDVSISANKASGVSVNFATTDSDSTLTTGTDKAAYLTAYVPAKLTINGTVSSGSVSSNTVSGDYVTSASANKAVVVTDTTPGVIGFALAKYDTTSNTVSKNNASTFTFSGKVNSAANWANGDFSVVGDFTFSGLQPENYNALTIDPENNFVAGGGTTVDPTKTKTYSRAARGNVVFNNVQLPSGATSVTSISLVGNNDSVPKTPATPTVWTFSGGTLTFNASAGVFANDLWITDTYSITMTCNNGAKITGYSLIIAN